MRKLKMSQRMSGAQILLESLVQEGVTTVFGHPGGANLPLYDELYRYQKRVRHILVRHEQGGAHAADGYARVSGKAGVCFATSGPGATNLVTGIASAMMDSIPMVAITANVPSYVLGSDAFQETDISGITQPIVKHSYLVTQPKDIARVVKEAFFIAQHGRPGPVHVDITKDALAAKSAFKYPKKVQLPGFVPEPLVASSSDITDAIGLICAAKRLVIIAGHGVVISRALKELRVFVEKTRIPVANTILGFGSFAQNNYHWLGMLGMHGLATANYAIAEADLVIGIGIRFDDRITGDLDAFKKINASFILTLIRRSLTRM